MADSLFIDNVVIKVIQETHYSLDESKFSIGPLLSVIEDIISLTPAPLYKGEDILEIRDKRTGYFDDINLGNDTNMQEKLVAKINTISWETLRNCDSTENMQDTVLAIFNSVSKFFWPGKSVLALAAFAVNYGEFWLVEQLHSSDPVAETIAFLEQLPTGRDQIMMFGNMAQLMKAVLKLTKFICESVDLQSNEYLKPDMPEYKNMVAQFPEYTYWIIRSIVICQLHLSNPNASDIEESNVTKLVQKVTQLADTMRMQLDICNMKAEEIRIIESKRKLQKLEATPNKDIVMVLKAFISNKEEMPLYNGSSKTLVSIDSLAKKHVLLYLSELKHLPWEISALRQLFLSPEKKKTDYEIVWLPVVDRSFSTKPDKKKLFKDIQEAMPWLSLRELSLVDPAVVKFIREVWLFKRRSMAKPLDPQGRLINSDALNMIFIWGDFAFPFTLVREEALWREEYWRVELLLGSIAPPAIAEWVSGGNHLCLYGGEDMDWIRKFATTLPGLFRQAQIPLMMLYMGTSNANGIVEKNNATLAAQKLSYIISDLVKIKWFWVRLESICLSRMRMGTAHPKNDEIIREAIKMRSFDCSGRNWAIVWEGSTKMANGFGDKMMKALSEYDQWKGNVAVKGFVPALDEHMSSIGTSNLCNMFSVPRVISRRLEKMECFECRREMSKTIRFSCCGD